MEYHHTQIGTVIVAGIGLALVGIIVEILFLGIIHPVIVGVGSLLSVVLFLFSSLTVEVRSGTVFVRFGPGIIHKEIRLSEITEARPVINPWMAGWGIRWLPGHYVMWNVSGLRAVELTLTDGKRFRIGTDEPEKLATAIEMGRKR
jgi:hypothetical protein